MELLTSSKTTYLLEAGLEILHEQSNEWLSEISFWREEVSFYYTMIIRKTHLSVPVNSKDAINLIEKELDVISGGELDTLQKEVEAHERSLYIFLKDKVGTDREYREAHKKLNHEFENFEKKLKLIKRDIFSLIKLISENVEK